MDNKQEFPNVMNYNFPEVTRVLRRSMANFNYKQITFISTLFLLLEPLP